MKDHHRIYKCFAVILFGCLLVLPMLQIIFHILPEKNVTGENRALAEMPTLDSTFLEEFPTKYDSYVNDHFPGRNLFLNIYFKYCIHNHQSPIPSVIIGKDNFLFCGKEELELFKGEKDYFTDDDMDMTIQELRHRQEVLQQNGISLYVFLVPTALEIYPEYLPKYIQRTPCTATETFLKKMKRQAPDLPCTYIKKELLNHKDSELLYLKNNNHWTALGAYYGANAIMQRLSKDYPTLPQNILGQFQFISFTSENGNLSDWLSTGSKHNLTWESTDYRVSYRDTLHCQITEDTVQDFESIPGFPYPKEYEKQFRTQQKEAPNILFIRDSFTTAMIPFLSPYFNNSLFIFDGWQYGANWDIVQKVQPDIVVLVIYEPNIRNIALTLKW